MKTKYRTIASRYSFFIPSDLGGLLYNSRTGAVIVLKGKDSDRLGKRLGSEIFEIKKKSLSKSLLKSLLDGGFLIPDDHNELLEIKKRFLEARYKTPAVITLTTTQDCNLGCYYCYEERSQAKLTNADVPSIVALARRTLVQSHKKTLHVDWYGGEPLLNIAFLEAASDALQDLCLNLNVSFEASIISNGTTWPADVGRFVKRHKIIQAQISFDGLKKNHDKRRRYRMGYKPSENLSSFDRAIDLVDTLLNFTRVDVRFNIDRINQVDIFPFIKFMEDKGWFDKPYPAVFQPARLASYSDHSAFMRDRELTLDEFDLIRNKIRDCSQGQLAIEESEVPEGYPFPKTSVCAALAHDSVVIGADGQEYRCGLQVGENNRSVGEIQPQKSNRELPVLGNQYADKTWWEEFDPTALPKCSQCSFLPICWGGCPKKHLENDNHALDEQSVYWQKNLPRLISSAIGANIPKSFALSEQVQFR